MTPAFFMNRFSKKQAGKEDSSFLTVQKAGHTSLFLRKKRRSQYSGAASIVLFLAVLFLLFTAFDSLSERYMEEQKETLIRALHQSTLQCYAAEGFYPESLQYLEEHYRIRYDKSVFFVDYQPIGKNIMPDITVIRKN